MISGDFFRLTAPRCPSMAAGAVSLRKSHDIVILSFCNIVKGTKVTRSTSAHALPLFLPAPKIQSRKPLFRAKNNPEIPFPAPF